MEKMALTIEEMTEAGGGSRNTLYRAIADKKNSRFVRGGGPQSPSLKTSPITSKVCRTITRRRRDVGATSDTPDAMGPSAKHGP